VVARVKRDGDAVVIETDNRRDYAVGNGKLLLGIALAPLAWVLAELVGYVLASRSCEPPTNGLRAYGVTHPATALVVIDVALILVGLFGLFTAWSSVLALRDDHPPGDFRVQQQSGALPPRDKGADPTFTRSRFVAMTGVLASSLFTLGIILFGIAPFFLDVCRAAP
jgi:hypothetical protein